MMNIKDYITEVPDFPLEGVNFKDITGILAAPEALRYCVDALANYSRENSIEAIVSPDARGWLFAAGVALTQRLPLHIVRKPGKLPPDTKGVFYDYEYASGTLEIKADADLQGKRVLIIDDVNATGGTALAVTQMLRDHFAVDSIFYGAVMDLTYLDGSAKLNAQKVSTYSIVEY